MEDYDLDDAIESLRDGIIEHVEQEMEVYLDDYTDEDYDDATPLESFRDHLTDCIGEQKGIPFELYSEMRGKISAAVTEFFTKIKPLVEKYEAEEEPDED